MMSQMGGAGGQVKMIICLIKAITNFSNVIGYQQPDLSINWAVYKSCLYLDSAHHFVRAVAVHFVEKTAGFFGIHNDI